MAFTYNAVLLLGSSQTGLSSTLRAALMDTTGTIHATHRDISTGFVEVGGGNYSWVYALTPDSYRGAAVFYTGTLGGAATDFSGVTVKTASPVTPEEYGGLLDGAITDAKITMPAEAVGAPSTALQTLLWIAGCFGLRKVVKDPTTIKQYMADSTTLKTSSTYTSAAGTDTIDRAV